MPLTPEQRTQRAKLAAFSRWGRTPVDARIEATAPAQLAALQPFLAQVDLENPGLNDMERLRLARSKLGAHMARVALARSRAGDPPDAA